MQEGAKIKTKQKQHLVKSSLEIIFGEFKWSWECLECLNIICHMDMIRIGQPQEFVRRS